NMYIHVFGGVANTAYNAEILSRATEEGVRHSTFEHAIAAAAKGCKNAGVAAGVHSDTHSETAHEIDLASSEPIGCGYIKLRRDISREIADNAVAIIAAAESSRPELFTDPDDTSFAHAVVQAHVSLAANDEYFGESRAVAGAAIAEGAPTMLVDGDHVATQGIINLASDTTIDSGTAFEAGKSIYVHDAWASEQLAKNYGNARNFSAKSWQIADLIDAIGTMRALGVTTIAVREQP
ncbi:MAG TPA: hypothetical protein VFL85_03035, partial [Candidatus Saccharimonadales bacterium]|nr:hypothetical protein [Candidatus Saccharimonadales bacterium]